MQLAILFEHFKRVGKINKMWINPVDAWLHPWLYNLDPKIQPIQQALTGRIVVKGSGCAGGRDYVKMRSVQSAPNQGIPGFIGPGDIMTPPRNASEYQYGFDSPMGEYDNSTGADLDGGVSHWDNEIHTDAALSIISLQGGKKSNKIGEGGQQTMVRRKFFICNMCWCLVGRI
jgi:hypothetical protein